MKSKRGNISILIIFILLASSLLGILSMNFVQQMIKQSAVVNSYYTSYYLAKAGLELGFVQIKHRGIGFDYVVNSNDPIVLDNFLCEPNCSLAMNLSGTASLLSQKFRQEGSGGCSFPYVLSSGESLIVPLFRDRYVGPVAGIFNASIAYDDLTTLLQDGKINILTPLSDTVTFGLVILSGEDLDENGIYFKKGSLTTASLDDFQKSFPAYMINVNSFLAAFYQNNSIISNGYKIYLMISNSASDSQSLCLSIDSTMGTSAVLPTDRFFIKSQASYGNQKVALDAFYAQPIPSFLFDTYRSF